MTFNIKVDSLLVRGVESLVVGAGSHRFRTHTLAILDGDDVYLSTTNIDTPRNAAWIRSHAGLNEEFIWLTKKPKSWADAANPDEDVPLNQQEAYRQYTSSGAGTDWEEGQLARFGVNWYVVNVDHQQSIGESPVGNDDFGAILQWRRLTQPTYLALPTKHDGTLYITDDSSNAIRVYLGSLLIAGP